jgi:hypothetical protein
MRYWYYISICLKRLEGETRALEIHSAVSVSYSSHFSKYDTLILARFLRLPSYSSPPQASDLSPCQKSRSMGVKKRSILGLEERADQEKIAVL